MNTGKMMVLEAGMKFQPVDLNPEDAQMLQSRAFNIEEICRWFRVWPGLIGHTARADDVGSGVEQMLIGFLTFSLRPWLTRIEQAIRKSLRLREKEISTSLSFPSKVSYVPTAPPVPLFTQR